MLNNDLENILVVENRTLFDNKSVAANGFSTDTSTFSAKTGYTAIGIVGFEVSNASSSGAGSSGITFGICYLSSATSAFTQITNRGTGAAKVKAVARILFLKNDFIST